MNRELAADIVDLVESCENDERLPGDAQCAIYFANYASLVCIAKTSYQRFKVRLTPHLGTGVRRWVSGSGRNPGRFLVVRLPAMQFHHPLIQELRKIAYGARNRLKAEERRKRLKAGEGRHLKSHYRVLWGLQGGCCYFTGESLGDHFEERKFAVDHLTPVVLDGTNWPTNLALVLPWVNRLKKGLDLRVFLRRVERQKLFTLRALTERRAIDRARRTAFRSFVTSSRDEANTGVAPARKRLPRRR